MGISFTNSHLPPLVFALLLISWHSAFAQIEISWILFPGIGACVKDIASNGLTAFYKGFIPAFTRLGPQTVLTFVFFEQLRLKFGRDVPKWWQAMIMSRTLSQPIRTRVAQPNVIDRKNSNIHFFQLILLFVHGCNSLVILWNCYA